ncbi:hypothetical protein SHVI106290_00250 [Shewanella violacea]
MWQLSYPPVSFSPIDSISAMGYVFTERMLQIRSVTEYGDQT